MKSKWVIASLFFGVAIVLFRADELYAAANEHYYRFENTVSNTTPVTDGASLGLDGASQIKDGIGTRQGNPFSNDSIHFGTYENADGIVAPVAASNIMGAVNNNFYAKLSSSNDEGIDLGDFDADSGLTIQGWVYPTGSKVDAFYNTRIVTKRSAWQAGNFWLLLNAGGGVSFGVYTSDDYYEWNSAANQVDWTKWNYIAVTWQKNSNQVDFYIQPEGGTLVRNTVTNESYAGTFPNTSDTVTIGYNANFDLGFDGYLDEMKLSDYKMKQHELLIAPIANMDHYYRFESTHSNSTPVTDGATLRLDGANQITDDLGARRGNPVSSDDIHFGTYENAVSAVNPVSASEIAGPASNNFFAKLNNSNDEGIDLGEFDVGYGLTIEGWVYPTGYKPGAYSNARFVTKRSGWQPGNFWSYLNADGGVTFGVYTSTGYYEWSSSADKVDWAKWNYVAITWGKGSRAVDFYIKPEGEALFHETITNLSYDIAGTFPNTSDTVTIGYNANFDAGFDGYVDEVKLSNYRKVKDELLVEHTPDAAQSSGDFIAEIDPTGDSNLPTFGSFNQHIAEIDGIYYASYLDEDQYIHIVKSADGGETWSDLYASGNHKGDQPAVLAADNDGRLHAVWADVNVGRYMRFSGSPLTLDIDKTVGECGTKFSMVYNARDDVLHWSRREAGDLYVVTLDTSGDVVSSTELVDFVGTWGDPGDPYWDAHYHSLYVDPAGTVHLIYNPHEFPTATTFIRRKILYMYSDDAGVTWNAADGTSASIPFDTDDYSQATEISDEAEATIGSVLATDEHIHILYYGSVDDSPVLKYVRLNRSTGDEEKNYGIPNMSLHSTLVADPDSDKLYIAGEENNRPSLMMSTNSGDSWNLFRHLLVPPSMDYYFSTTAAQHVVEGSIVALTTDIRDPGVRKVKFYKFKLGEDHEYRFESTAANTTAVTDGASLRLDGANQIKDSLGARQGNPNSANEIQFGTYESAVGAVNPVSAGEIAGAPSNNFYAKLNNSNDEGIDIGDFDAASGLTIQGWVYPTGNKQDAYNNTRFVTKRSGWQPGNFWSLLNASGGVTFGVYSSSDVYEWHSSADKVDWTKWNYIAITWNKNSNKVDFYIQPAGEALFHETITNGSYSGTFPNIADTVTLGYNPNFDLGFEGYLDEVKVSNYKMRQDELSVAQ